MPEVGSERPKVSLSCLQCQQRKKKCDKGQPCQACKQNGLDCATVSRARLPRGRRTNARNTNDLKQRAARLESLLADGIESRSNGKSQKLACDDVETRNTAWTALSEEVYAWCEVFNSMYSYLIATQVLGIRELLDVEQPVDETFPRPPETHVTSAGDTRNFDILLYSNAPCWVEPGILSPPPKALTFALLDTYLHGVDPVLKVTHEPSLRTLLLENANASLAQEALKFAIHFTTLSTLDEAECLEIVGVEKLEAVAKFRLGTEVLLSKAGLLTTRNLTVLQAFVVYLVSRIAHATACLIFFRLDFELAVAVAPCGL